MSLLDSLDPFAGKAPLSEEAPAPPASGSLYDRVFAIHEIAESAPLQWVFRALLGGFFVTYSRWFGDDNLLSREAYEQNRNMTWPWFQGAGRFMVLSSPWSGGHSHACVFALAFALLAAATAFSLRNRWSAAHACMLVLFVAKGLILLVNNSSWANLHLTHLSCCAVFLLFPHKLYFVRRAVVLNYVLSGTIKIQGGWLAGTYFSSLSGGIPLVPSLLIPLATTAVVALELVFSWLLLARDPRLQRVSLLLFVGFHVYSVALVGFDYPTIVLPVLLAGFAPRIQTAKFPMLVGALAPATLLILFSAGHALRFVVPDQELTMAMNMYGLHMFDANHQCISTVQAPGRDGVPVMHRVYHSGALTSCDPYAFWYRAKRGTCQARGERRVAWQLDHSINGGPFYRIVDVPDVCSLPFRAFGLNPWIRPRPRAEVVGYPVKNGLHEPAQLRGRESQDMPLDVRIDAATERRLLVLPGLERNEPVELGTTQSWLLEEIGPLELFWWCILAAMAGVRLVGAFTPARKVTEPGFR